MHPSPAAAEHLSQVRLCVERALLPASIQRPGTVPVNASGRETCLMTLQIINSPAKESSHACWSCGDMRAAHFCGACGKVQPPAPVDYFSFFGLPRKLNIDVKA